MSNDSVIWLTGLPCSGKSTIAREVARQNPDIKVLDGDIVRIQTGHSDFSYEGRLRQARQVALMAKERQGNVIVAIVSPFEDCRKIAHEILNKRYIEVYLKCSLDTCIARDVKGMYKKAMSGEIRNFTGISSSYETPQNPHVVIDTERLKTEQCVKIVQSLL